MDVIYWIHQPVFECNSKTKQGETTAGHGNEIAIPQPGSFNPGVTIGHSRYGPIGARDKAAALPFIIISHGCPIISEKIHLR